MPTRGGRRRSANRSFTARETRQNATKPEAPTSASQPQSIVFPREHEYEFWLVQRLNRNTRPERGWFGDKFKLEPMGSTEFEIGTQHHSVERMRERGHFVIVPIELIRKGVTRTVFCIGPNWDMSDKIVDFTAWASQYVLRAKEWTKFDVMFDDDFSLFPCEYIDTVAWWSLDDDFLWTLDSEVAEQLLYGLEHPATA